jgi:hypothetical protein
MRPSERLRQLEGISDKFRDLSKAKTLVKFKQPVGIPSDGRPLYKNCQDPFQFDSVRRARINQAEMNQRERSELEIINIAPNDACINAWKSLDDPGLNVRRLDRSVPGYRGFVPGRRAENIHHLTHARVSALSDLMTR